MSEPRIKLALLGDGWWTLTLEFPGHPPVMCRTDASRPIPEAFVRWLDELAAGRIPAPIRMDEEPQEVVIGVAETDDPETVRLTVTRDPVNGQSVAVLIDLQVDCWELAKGLDSALEMIGRSLQGTEATRDWLA